MLMAPSAARSDEVLVVANLRNLISLSRIAGQFGLSQSDVRMALASADSRR